MSGDLLPGYPAGPVDEAVGPDGRLRAAYAVLGPVLRRLGEPGLTAASGALALEREARGVAVPSWTDGRPRAQRVPLDPLPRVLTAAEWAQLAAGAEQRHRAVNAFLADAYRPAGRRRGDTDRDPEIVRAGLLPDWLVARSPAREPDAVGFAWSGQPRVALAATDVVRTADGGWTVLRDDLRVPAGLGLALAGRDSMRAAVPGLFPAGGGPVDPWTAVPLLRAALAAAAPPACPGAPRPAVLASGDGAGARFEEQLLADALDAPLVGAADLWPRADGGVEASVGGERLPVDVLYRRLDDASLRAHPTPAGPTVALLLAEAVRAGRLGLANVPGNGLADDAATSAVVPEMIRFYLGEQPLLRSVRTWVLADDDQWRQVRDRLHELVVEPVAGYGGGGAVDGPSSSPAELAQLQAEVTAAPHRFVAREPVRPSTVPTVVEGGLRPRHVDLRVFSVAAPEPRALPAPLTRVALREGAVDTAPGDGGGSKDTWLLG